ncbi:hypothetical protein SSIG_07021 [Streptomyces filamentosus NRRL 11379]|nr:hypothetical protein SSIG_07021 [Streptomyces filamentosus NRRL 11379]
MQSVGELLRYRLHAEQPGGQLAGLRRRQRCEVPLDDRYVGGCPQREGEAVARLGIGVGRGMAARGEYESQPGRRVGDDRTEKCAGGCVGPLKVLDDQDGLPQRCRVRVQGAQNAVVFGARVSQRRRRGREAIREVGQQSVQGPGHRRQVRRERSGAEAVQRLDERRERGGLVRVLAAGDQGDGTRWRGPSQEFVDESALPCPRLAGDHHDGGSAVQLWAHLVQEGGASDQETGGGGRRLGVHGFLPRS